MDRKLNFKIGGIVAIAVVAAIVGTLAFTSLETNSDSQTQSIGIGAFVTVEAYHEDGTLFQKWEGHNALSVSARNALVGCITGLDTTFPEFFTCALNITKIKLIVLAEDDFSSQTFVSDSIISLLPEGCDTNRVADPCSGWIMEATFDFNTLDCTPTVDCVLAHSLQSARSVIGGVFNSVSIQPRIPIVPDDRLVVTMTFDIPA